MGRWKRPTATGSDQVEKWKRAQAAQKRARRRRRKREPQITGYVIPPPARPPGEGSHGDA